MKKLLGIVVLGLLWCNVGFAGERYSDLIAKSKTAKGQEIIEVMKETIIAYELEISFLEDCINEIMILKKDKGKKCTKMSKRMKRAFELTDVANDPNFYKKILEIEKGTNSGKISYINAKEFKAIIDEYGDKHIKIITLYEKLHSLTVKKSNKINLRCQEGESEPWTLQIIAPEKEDQKQTTGTVFFDDGSGTVHGNPSSVEIKKNYYIVNSPTYVPDESGERKIFMELVFKIDRFSLNFTSKMISYKKDGTIRSKGSWSKIGQCSKVKRQI